MKKLLIWARRILAVLLLGLVIWQLHDLSRLRTLLSQVQPLYLVVCILIYILSVGLSCLKWRLLLQSQGHNVAFPTLMHWYLLGAFAGTFLPSSIGGDIGRSYIAGRGIGSQADALMSIFAERVTGLIAMLALAAITLAIVPEILNMPAFVPFGLLVLMILSGAIAILLIRYQPVWLPTYLRKLFGYISNTFQQYRAQPSTLLLAMLISLLFHGLTAVSLWIACLSVTPSAPASTALVAPLIGLTGIIPLTPGSLGIREGALAYLLQHNGLSLDQAVAVALITRALLFISALAGMPGFFIEMHGRTRKVPKNIPSK